MKRLFSWRSEVIHGLPRRCGSRVADESIPITIRASRPGRTFATRASCGRFRGNLLGAALGQRRARNEKTDRQRQTGCNAKGVWSFGDPPLAQTLSWLMADEDAHNPDGENYPADDSNRFRCPGCTRTSEKECTEKNANSGDEVVPLLVNEYFARSIKPSGQNTPVSPSAIIKVAVNKRRAFMRLIRLVQKTFVSQCFRRKRWQRSDRYPPCRSTPRRAARRRRLRR